MVAEAAGRLVAGPARHLGLGLDHRGDRIERRPVPGAGRAENADRRRPDGGGDVEQAGIVGDHDVRGGGGEDRVAQVGAGEIAAPRRRRGDDLRGEVLFERPADHPDRIAARGEVAHQLGISAPSLRRTDGARRDHRHRPRVAEPHALAPPPHLFRRHHELRQRPVGGERGALGQRERGAAVDHARQRLLPRTEIVDEAEPHLAEKAGAHGDAGERRRERRLPGPRHDQRVAITLAAQHVGELAMERPGEALARQVEHDPLAHAGHVVEERRDHGGGQHVDRPVREALLEEPHHRVAAHEIADPHVGHDQDRSLAARSIDVFFQSLGPPAGGCAKVLIDRARRPRRHRRAGVAVPGRLGQRMSRGRSGGLGA